MTRFEDWTRRAVWAVLAITAFNIYVPPTESLWRCVSAWILMVLAFEIDAERKRQKL